MSVKSPVDPALAAVLSCTPATPLLLLHAGRLHPRWADRSIVAHPAVWFSHTADHRSQLDPPQTGVRLSHHPWRDLCTLLNHRRFQSGFWVGYFSYDLAYVIEQHKLGPHHHAGPHPWPLIQLAWCPQADEFTPPASPIGVTRFSGSVCSTTPCSDFTRAEYESAVARILDYISAGDVFQVNLAQRLRCRYTGNPRNLFARLAAVSPAWYGAYLELPNEKILMSTSPELFLELQNGRVTTRPIKGTRPNLNPEPRTLNPPNDDQYHSLLHSEKDAAELHMIVDLMRNDLGKVCSYGSVRVVESRTIETHPTVHHGVATITGCLHESRDVVDLLRATLPGGSVTGAPKVRAMQIIDELEPAPRGPYTGAIGWITKNACCLNVAIRTMTLDNAQQANPTAQSPDHQIAESPNPTYDVSFHVGGGIVADSDPHAEYDETLDKAAAILQALNTHVAAT
jgi:para-aminobenzoate synthetase component I